MSRPSLPSTPLPGTPNLRIPSPARTPSPLPLFSTGGPYTYTGLITRKYSSRFNEITKKKNNVKDAEGQWEIEAKKRGVTIEELVKSQQLQYKWEEEDSALRRMQSPLQESMASNVENRTQEEARNDIERKSEKRLSVEDEHFVDALTSPVEKPKDWGDLSTGINT